MPFRKFKPPILPLTSLTRRRIILPKYRKRLVAFLQEKLSNPRSAESFMMSLPCAKMGMPSTCLVRLFNFEGTKVVIKNTLGANKHGQNPSWVRLDILRHLKTFRKNNAPKTYTLRAPQLYGHFGSYLVMEAVENKTKEMLEDHNLSPQVVIAFKELKDNLKQLSALSPMKHPLQAHHFMCAGIKKGKVLFYAPYDYEEYA